MPTLLVEVGELGVKRTIIILLLLLVFGLELDGHDVGEEYERAIEVDCLLLSRLKL